MSDKFLDLPVDSETSIFFRLPIQIGSIDALHEKWSWDGISAESIIFCSEDVKSLEEPELVALLKNSGVKMTSTTITLKRGENGYTFVNFNFETDDD